jgi:putative peptidoglycan lipid II flippase
MVHGDGSGEQAVSEGQGVAEQISLPDEQGTGAKPWMARPSSSAPQTPSPVRPPPRQGNVHRRISWAGRMFGFRLTSFRLGRDLATRQFSLTEAAFLLILAYLTSKGFGLIRQMLFNALFGTGPQATAYYAAFNLPDTLFNLIAGGAFTYAFIPVFLSYEKEHGQQEVWRLASLVLNVLLVTLTVLVLGAELFAPAIVNTLLVPGLPPPERDLTATLTRIMLLHSLILGLGTVATAILNGKGQFLLPAIAIAIYDLGLIGGLLVSLALPGVGIYGPTYGLLVSGVCQVAVQLPGLRKQGARYSWLWDLRHPGLHQVVRLLLPNMLAVGLASVAIFLETAFASYLPDPASIPALRNASLLFGLPVTLVSQVVGQALLPHITAHATHNRYVRMSQTVLKSVTACVLLSIPAALVLSVGGRLAIQLLFQHGAFDPHASMLTARALLGYAVGLPGLTASGLLILSFYALKDARTPLLTNIGTFVVRVSLLLLLLRVFSGDMAILAIPLAASVTGTAEAMLLGLLLFSRLRSKVSMDKGLQRLHRRREYTKRRLTATQQPDPEEVQAKKPPVVPPRISLPDRKSVPETPSI